MGHKVRGVAVYQGLFLMVFGLYASKVPVSSILKVSAPPSQVLQSGETPIMDPILKVNQELEKIPVFQGKIEGVELKASGRSLQIEIRSEDLYRPGAIEIEPVWHSSLIQIGQEVYSELDPVLQLEITGFGALGESRAKWLSGYFKNQFQGRKNTLIRLFVVDGETGTDRIRLRVSYKDE